MSPLAALLPCPFCGSAADRGPMIHGSISVTSLVRCTNKRCGATVKSNTTGRASDAWNARVASRSEA